MPCLRCGTAAPSGSKFCPSCGAGLPASDAETRLDGGPGAGDETRLAAPTPSGRSSASGWLSSSDHGRFEPGTVVDGRYRIIALLGKGGMGEVFRADDLRLGQPVALKFLPDALASDVDRLAQFHTEVRTARQVSHPNVCRVHDIGEVDGRPYISMEYVDGEDLATSLRRIGHVPEDRAIEIARQICAGLAAAHERGVLHRDLKPANIMLDGAGRVRVMDFGLASIGDVGDVRAGTPAYMAPEQLQGREVSVRSDIYALGLVLYEVFTGKRVYDVSTIADLVGRHESGAITRPSEHVKNLDPALERAILRCLDRDPARRPSSALAVSASLPGGDPLAAALAAGETPSPAMVAAAGGQAAAVSPIVGVLVVLASILGILAAAGWASRFELVGIAPMPLHPRTLVDRARQFESSLNLLTSPRDREHGLFTNGDIESWLWSLPAADRERLLADNWPSPILFWQRTSPRLLVPSDPGRVRPTRGDPPLGVTGMTIVATGTDGRLMEFVQVPEQVERMDTDGDVRPVEWSTFFTAAGLDPSRFAPVSPTWTPRFYADDRRAWQETVAGPVGEPLRIEAASHRGQPVNFQIIGPWARPTRSEAAPVNANRQIIFITASVIIVPAVITAGILLARRNLRLGRGDRRGALVMAALVFTVSMLLWLFGARHFAALLEEQTRFARALAAALLSAAVYGLLYLAVEPTVRRVWPQILITWSRVVRGRLRDPLVGRDLMVGVIAGLLETLVTFGHHFLPALTGLAPFRPAPVDLTAMLDIGQFVTAAIFVPMRVGLENAVLAAVGLVLVRMVVRRAWPTVPILLVLFAPLAAQGQIESGLLWLDLSIGAVLVSIILLATLRYGLVAGFVTFFIHILTKNIPMTFDGSRLYFGSGALVMAVVVAVAVTGFVLARAGEPLFGRLAED